jgi:TRAP-type C4-dicarboxylate transport system substrate-binding protein
LPAEEIAISAICAVPVVKIGKSMLKMAAPCALLLFVLSPYVAVAEPIELKLAFFSSDQSMTYLAAIKPFVDAVNLEGHDQVKIVLYSGGVLGREISQQPATRQPNFQIIRSSNYQAYSTTHEKPPWSIPG